MSIWTKHLSEETHIYHTEGQKSRRIFKSSGMWRFVRLQVFPEISKDLNFFIFRVKHSKKNLQTLEEIKARRHSTTHLKTWNFSNVATTSLLTQIINCSLLLSDHVFCNLRRLTSNDKSVHTSQTMFLFHVELYVLDLAVQE